MDGNMGGMMMPPASSSSKNGSSNMWMMHMTFFWGKDTDILFRKWPGGRTGMYALALVFVFLMAVLVEFLSHTRFIKPPSNHLLSALLKTFLHVLRVGLAYLVMLSLMSFNGGVFLAAILGHALGFFLAAVFHQPPQDLAFDLPPISC